MKGWDELTDAAVKEAVRQQQEYDKECCRGESVLSDRHPLSDKFHTILMELGLLHDKKQKDYGRKDDPFANVRASSDFGIDGWVGAMVRANDKMRRIQKAAYASVYGQPMPLVNESVIDSFNDLAVYAVIARVLYEEQHVEMAQGKRG